jgi:glutathione S-transferase
MPVEPALVLYYFPRACSLAAHIALEESGLAYERRIVHLPRQENRTPAYLSTNPNGAVPALTIGQQTLTETQAILTYVGDRVSEGKLLPPAGDLRRYRAHEWMNFLSSSIHTYVRSIFRSVVYAGNDEQACIAVNAQGVNNLAKATAIIEQRLDGQTWALGDAFSVADAYLFVMYLWTTDERIASIPERPNWEALAKRVWLRPAVQHIVAIEQKDRNYAIPWE